MTQTRDPSTGQLFIDGAGLHRSDVPIPLAVFAPYELTGITSTWPGSDAFSLSFPVSVAIRSIRFRAFRTTGSTADANVRYVLDANNEAEAEQLLIGASVDANVFPQPHHRLFDEDKWSEWLEFDTRDTVQPLRRVDFLPTADTWTILVEVA